MKENEDSKMSTRFLVFSNREDITTRELRPWHSLVSSDPKSGDVTPKSQFRCKILIRNLSCICFLSVYFLPLKSHCPIQQLHWRACPHCSMLDFHILIPARSFVLSPNSHKENSVDFAQRLPSILR